MGSKRRIAKYILPFLKEHLNGENWFVDAFCGGCNLIDKLDYSKRIANDSNEYLIALFKGLIEGCFDDQGYVAKDLYKRVRDNKSDFVSPFVGYVGFVCSVNGKFFNGFSGICNTKQGIRNYQDEKLNSLLVVKRKLDDVKFCCGSYEKINLPYHSVIYCDPPYRGTTGYKDTFDHDKFWQWCRDKAKEGHKVFISEYNAPDDFECVWQMEITNSLSTKNTYKPIEKLFTYNI